MKRLASLAGLVPCVFAILTVPLVFCAIFGHIGTQFVDEIGYTGVLFLLVVACIVLLATLFVAYRAIDRLSERGVRIATARLFALMAFGMIVLLCNFHALHVSDQWVTLDQARYLALNPGTMIDKSSPYAEYFGNYGNNYFAVVIFMQLYRLAAALHIADDYSMLCIINAACVYAANALAYACVRCMRGPRAAAKALVVLVLNPISYPLIFWVYTCTMSAPLLAGAVWLALLAYKAEDMPHQILFAALSGVVGALSYQIRPTSLLPLVATALLAFLYICGRRDQVKRVAMQAGVCLVTLLLLTKALSLAYKPYVSQEVLDDNFPITHWVMMSAHDNGSYDREDMKYTLQFATKAEKRDATIKRAAEYYRDNGVSGTLRLFVRKLSNTFCDGESVGPSRLAQDVRFGALYPYLADDRRDFFVLFCQAFRAVTLGLMAAAGILLWRRRETAPDWWLMMTTVMGGYVFYCLWETKSVYSMPFVPIMCCCASLGCSELIARIESLSEQRRAQIKQWSWTALAATVGLALVVMYSVLVKTDYVHRDYIRRESTTRKQVDSIAGLSKEGDTLTQELAIGKPINRIAVDAWPQGEGDDHSVYRLDLCDASGAVVDSKEFDSSQLKNSVVPLELTFDPGDEPQDCTVRITLLHKGSYTLRFLHREQLSIDAYPGRLFIGDQESPYDLEFSAYYVQEKPYLRGRWCVLLYALLAGYIVALYKLSNWADRPVAKPSVTNDTV